MSKYIYSFGNGTAEGQGSMRALLGGKGANLADMASIGLPVPPGFTITTEACAKYYEVGEQTLDELLQDEVRAAMNRLEALTGKTFGGGANPRSSRSARARPPRCPA